MVRFALGVFFLANGVFCEVNDVILFAKNAAECLKAGGVVTHTVKTEVKEVGSDNPDKEPEIQRGNDKEQDAP